MITPESFIFGWSTPTIIIVTLAVLLGAAELGFRRGRVSQASEHPSALPQLNTVQGALLGLLALLLGFSFSMAGSRFEQRRQLVIEEANAIGTLSLRAQLLPEAQRAPAAALLVRYLDARIDFYEHADTEDQLAITVRATERLQSELWATTAGLDRNAAPAVVSLYVVALNEVFDVRSTRLAAFSNRVPDAIVVLLYLMAAMALAVVGFGNGLAGRRGKLTLLVALLISTVMVVILDLDRPRRGWVTISDQPLKTLRANLAPPAH